MPQLRRQRAGPSSPTPVEVKLRKVIPVIPSKEPEKSQLMEDLDSMGCLGFAKKPWGFREDRVVKELLGGLSNEFSNTIRGTPGLWKEEIWRTVYGFRVGGTGMANRKDEFIRNKFRGTVNPKDGYAIDDCIDDRNRRLLKFLIPVLHPEKPTRVTITLGNTIFGALSGNRKVDWARIIYDLVAQLVSRVGGSRASPLSPYLFHIYHEQQLLTNVEEKIWRTQEVLLKYGESETDEEVDSEPGSDPETEEEEEEPPLPPMKRQKTTPPNKRGTPSGRDKMAPEERPEVEKTVSEEEPDSQDPFANLITILCNVRADWEIKKRMLVAIGKLVDAPADSRLIDKVADCITNPVEARKQEQEIRQLKEEVAVLKAEISAFKKDVTSTREMAEETRKIAEQVKGTLGQPGMAVTKARLFDEKVLEEKKLSGSRMVQILTDFAEQVETAMTDARKAADRIEESSRSLTGIAFTKGIQLSDLSLPDSFPDVAVPGVGKDRTPESRKSRRRATLVETPGSRIDLDSTPGSEPDVVVPGSEGERNRNLNEIFEQMEPEDRSPTVGSRIAR